MNNYGLIAEQQALDTSAVAQTIADIDNYENTVGEHEYHDARARAASYTVGLYDEFAPGTAERARRMGVAVGSVGLALAEVRYGKDEYSPKLYSGSFEHAVLATYHHGAHPRRMMRSLFQYGAAINELRPGTYDDTAFAQFPGTAALHDIIMGNGRGHDERQSGLVAARLLPHFGFTEHDVETTVAGIDATAWDDERQAQAIDSAKPHVAYQRAAGVGDLFSLFTKRGLYEAVCLAPEDFCKQVNGQVFTYEARARGFSPAGKAVDECIEFIDSSGPLRAKFGAYMLDQPAFFANFKPADPALDDIIPGRAANVAIARELAAAHQTPNTITAKRTLEITREYAQGA